MGIFQAIFKSRDRPCDVSGDSVGGGRFFPFGRSWSGKFVTERIAMQTTAVYACVRIIAETVASLPIHVYEYTDNGKERVYTHPLYRILHDIPNPEMNSFILREVMISHLLLWGNSYSQIIRNGKGEIIALYPLMPEKMKIDRGADGKLYYSYISDKQGKNGAEVDIEWADNKLVSEVITPVADGNIKIGYDVEDTNLKVTSSDGTETVLAETDGVYELLFATAGTEYTIVPTNEDLSPVPTPSPTPETEITLTENHVSVSGPKSGTLIIAGYDQSGALIKTEFINGYDSDITGYENCTEIKAFLWDSVDGMEPLCGDKSVATTLY